MGCSCLWRCHSFSLSHSLSLSLWLRIMAMMMWWFGFSLAFSLLPLYRDSGWSQLKLLEIAGVRLSASCTSITVIIHHGVQRREGNMEVPPGFLELLSNTLTPDPNLRLKAEEQLRFLEKTELREYLSAVDHWRVRISTCPNRHSQRRTQKWGLTTGISQFVSLDGSL